MLVFWLIETVRSHWQLGRLRTDAGPLAGDDRFAQAQHEYLRGNWFEAEALLHAILAQAPRDAEAQLLLAGVLRHSGRYAAAQRRLSQLELLDTSARWTFEILREKKLLEQRQQSMEGEEQASERS
jgi:thioredoxin-like negative regulator of GroEL